MHAQETVADHEQHQTKAIHEDPYVMNGQPRHTTVDLGALIRTTHIQIPWTQRWPYSCHRVASRVKELAYAVIIKGDQDDNTVGINGIEHRRGHVLEKSKTKQKH
jgi:hypothetical protein